MKSGCVAKYPANYQLTPKNYFTRLEQDWIMMQSLEKQLKQKRNHPSEHTKVCWGEMSGVILKCHHETSSRQQSYLVTLFLRVEGKVR
jgi:hypothetical protein